MVPIIQYPSPNFGPRKDHKICNTIVLHYTDMQDAASALAHMCQPETQVSAHYLIDEAGCITQMVDETQRAWHAGVSFWREETDINSCSIGIELANTGHSFGLKPFPAPQINSLLILLHDIKSRYHIPDQNILAHSDIAPGRKIDPGPLFPWAQLAKEGIGYFPYLNNSNEKRKTQPLISQDEISLQLHQIGYQTTNINNTLSAFQLRYRPTKYDGILDEETANLIQNIYHHFCS